ncbi:hypothetical protein RRG08_066734, partial [Elysia crispata]
GGSFYFSSVGSLQWEAHSISLLWVHFSGRPILFLFCGLTSVGGPFYFSSVGSLQWEAHSISLLLWVHFSGRSFLFLAFLWVHFSGRLILFLFCGFTSVGGSFYFSSVGSLQWEAHSISLLWVHFSGRLILFLFCGLTSVECLILFLYCCGLILQWGGSFYFSSVVLTSVGGPAPISLLWAHFSGRPILYFSSVGSLQWESHLYFSNAVSFS